jgi:hypothetical protein
VTRAGMRGARTPRGAAEPQSLIHRSNCSKQALARVSGPFKPCMVSFPVGGDEVLHRLAIEMISGVVIEPLEEEGAHATRPT